MASDDPPPMVFMFSGLDAAMKEAMRVRVESLGGSVSGQDKCNSECTHLITADVLRNEKTMCFIASGKWILHTSYLDASLSEGKFVDPELYEFGNPKAVLCKPNDPILLERWSSCYYWRNKVAEQGAGAFHEMRAILLGEIKNISSLRMVIELGGGVIVEAQPPFDDTFHATHCILSTRKKPAGLDKLAQQGVYCVQSTFLQDFLFARDVNVLNVVLSSVAKYYK